MQRAADTGRAGPEVYDHLAAALTEKLRDAEAAAASQTAIELGGESTARLCTLGHARLEAGDVGEAGRAFARALERAPDSPAALTGLGRIASEAGDFDDAERRYRAAIDTEPASGEAWARLGEAQRLSAETDLPRIEAILADPAVPAEVAQGLHFAAATVLDKAGRHDDAFGHYRAGNDQITIRRTFDRTVFDADIAATIETFTPGLVARFEGAGSASKVPVFILGMPRSGTTLAEQITASHPDVFGAGECHFLPDSAETLQAGTGTAAAPQAVDAADGGLIAQAAKAHLKALTRLAPDAARVADKMPSNFRLLGLIPILFPDAAIVHCVRNPVDTCLSCYFQNFTHQPWSRDLADIAAFYRGYRRLMDHWAALFPGRILDLRYEDMVGDKDREARRLVAHLGLEWQGGVEDFHKSGRAIRTASLWQARQPVYTTSVARWKRYEKHLGPLIEALGELADE